MDVLDTPDAMRAWSAARTRRGQTIALVPTMGALHEGHLALIARARDAADVCVVSIFVNPLQFGEAADFEGYPRPIDDDLARCDVAGVDAVYAPTAAVMYPPGFETKVVTGALARSMEGASRPGHFDGVATVVTKLFTAVRPDLAVFGEKDFQQLAIIRALTRDLDLGVAIVAHPTVREADGLAMSSRNQRLDPAGRAAASCIPRAIAAARAAALDADATVASVVDVTTAVIAAEPLAELDYVALFDPDDLRPVTTLDGVDRAPGNVRIAIAARIEPVRLIDNGDLFDDA